MAKALTPAEISADNFLSHRLPLTTFFVVKVSRRKTELVRRGCFWPICEIWTHRCAVAASSA
jgi:hypothetical protein